MVHKGEIKEKMYSCSQIKRMQLSKIEEVVQSFV